MINPIDTWFIDNDYTLILFCGITIVGIYFWSRNPEKSKKGNWLYKKK